MRGITAQAVLEEGALVGGIRPDLVVPWWSFTKTVIAAAALVLVAEERLTLDSPLAGRPFTLRQLLQHRAGVPDYGGLASYHQAVNRDEEPWPVAAMLERAAGQPSFAPGQGWGYSNIGSLMVRRLIEETTGDPLGRALETLVLTPLSVGQVRLAEARSDLHGVTMGEGLAYHPGWVYHGLLVGPIQAAALLLDRLLAGVLLPPALLAEMRKAYPVGSAMPGRPWRHHGYGLGLMTGETRFGWRVEGHTGGGPGSSFAVYSSPDRRPRRCVASFAFGGPVRGVEAATVRELGPARR